MGTQRAIDRGPWDPKVLGKLANREALFTQFERPLHVEVPSRTTERFALPSSTLEACARSGHELLSFLLRDPPEDRHEQFPHGALGIEPRFAEAHDTHAQLIEGEHRLHVARHRASESIERPNEQHIEGATMRVVQELLQLWAVLRCADLFLVDVREDPAASGDELFKFGPLVVGGLLGRGGSQVQGRTRVHRSGLLDELDELDGLSGVTVVVVIPGAERQKPARETGCEHRV